MLMKSWSIPVLALIITACGSSKDGDQKLPAPDSGPYPFYTAKSVPVTVASDVPTLSLAFGPAWIQYRQENINKYAFMVENRGTEKVCPSSFRILATDEYGQTANGAPGLLGQMMNEGDGYEPCLAPNTKGYAVGFITGVLDLKDIKITQIYKGYLKNPQPLKQVSVVSQSINRDSITVTLRNETNDSLNATSSYSRWLLRKGDQVLDWGLFYEPTAQSVAPGATFEMKDDQHLGTLSSDTVLEFNAGYFYRSSN